MTSKTLRQFAAVTIITVLALTFFSTSITAFAQSNALAPTGGGSAFTSTGDDIVGTGQGDARTFVTNILRWALSFLGLVCVIMIIYGGFLYITAAGEEDKAKKGRTIILYCVIGIAIIAASYAIVNTVLGGVTAVGQ